MSFDLSFVQSFAAANFRQALPLAAANLKGALPWAAGVSIATSAKGLFSGKMLPEVSKLAGKMLSSAALSVAINTAATFLPERFAILKSSNAQHAVSALSTLFVSYLFSKPSLEAVFKKQGLYLVVENKLQETAEKNPGRMIFSFNSQSNELKMLIINETDEEKTLYSASYDPEMEDFQFNLSNRSTLYLPPTLVAKELKGMGYKV